MRLKIKGEVTAERLVEAFAAAVKKLQVSVPDAKFYGANVYLTAYDADGQAFDLVDGSGNSLVMNFSAPPGTIVKPALSAEAEQRREEARQQQRERDEAAQALHQQQLAERQQKLQVELALRQKAEKAFEGLNRVTDSVLASEPKALVEALNQVIESNWASLQPTEPHGPKKGQPKPMPVFSTYEGKLMLSTVTWKQPKQVSNPIGAVRKTLIGPLWTYSAWVTSTKGFLDVLQRLHGSLPEGILGDHLPGGAVEGEHLA
ncbi:hypothetical protein [Pseudomonas amygdali]|uniref:OfxX fusion product n=2 Tax=Pseudomonas amygdali pv. lachrymans TaxID=53707 RepID=A0ABR5KR97_PSEAV|nr:hypothetical protein [Pseudomonas amygdali]AXH59925.1 OfxX fusion product [Pseudomonas amygdali pv. lachrymans str. M301315]KPC17332.1 OfxX fusion product [Pseudomonas amygdali pv. lachrymans]RMT05823.1 OfxX fusion product [Pseudomonas amygdali pv. lachrymans]